MIVTSITSAPRRRPLQTRSRATFDVIVEAAAQLLAKQGILAFNTNDVAAKAGVSIGSVYQYFPDKECLLAEIKRRNAHTLSSSVCPIFRNSAGVSISTTMRMAVRTLIRHFVANEKLQQILETDVVILPEATMTEVMQQPGLKDIRWFLEQRCAELVVSDLDVASFMIARTFRSVINAALVSCPEKLRNGVVEDELTGFSVRYLTARG